MKCYNILCGMRGNVYNFVEFKIDVKELVPGRKKF